MNQTGSPMTICLNDLTDDNRPFGNLQGKKVFLQLCEIVEAAKDTTVFNISLEGIVATDASFPRESVISAARYYRGQYHFFLSKITNRDLIDNWKYAAMAKEQPLVIWNDDGSYEVIGPEMTESAAELLNYVLSKRQVSTVQVAADLSISVPNASTRLKRLVAEGYLLRKEQTADTGGLEYGYSAIQ